MNIRRYCDSGYLAIPEYKNIVAMDSMQSGDKLPYLMKFDSVFAYMNTPNGNDRVYYDYIFFGNKDCIGHFNTDLYKFRLKNGLVNGQISHPKDGEEALPEDISHVFDGFCKHTKDGNLLCCSGRIVDTVKGRVLYGLKQSGINLGLSQRSSSDAVMTDGLEILGTRYYLLEGGDFVSQPAVPEAFPEYKADSLKKANLTELLSPVLTGDSLKDGVEIAESLLKDRMDSESKFFVMDIEPGALNSKTDSVQATQEPDKGIPEMTDLVNDLITEVDTLKSTKSSAFDHKKVDSLMLFNYTLDRTIDTIPEFESRIKVSDSKLKEFKERYSSIFNSEKRLKGKLMDAVQRKVKAETALSSVQQACDALKDTNKKLETEVAILRKQVKDSQTESLKTKSDINTTKDSLKVNQQKQVDLTNKLKKVTDSLYSKELELYKYKKSMEAPIGKKMDALNAFKALQSVAEVDEAFKRLNVVNIPNSNSIRDSRIPEENLGTTSILFSRVIGGK